MQAFHFIANQQSISLLNLSFTEYRMNALGKRQSSNVLSAGLDI